MAYRQGQWVTRSHAGSFEALAELLWTEREALDELLCKVVVGELTARAAAQTAAQDAVDDVQREIASVLERLRLAEVLRAAEVEELARASRLPVDATLARLAEAAPEPWTTVLSDHEVALRTMLRDLESVAELRQLSLREFLG
jgi:hypothetical protein